MRASEGKTHWYTKEGEPQYTVIGKNGKERNATLRDARTMNLCPSVTTILKVAAAPALENWKIDQALLSALTLPREDGESLDSFMARAKQDAKDQVIQAAQKGTDIHTSIESGFLGALEGDYPEAYHNVGKLLTSLYGRLTWVPEASFSSPMGYGGKVDLHSLDHGGIVVDFKSKDNISGKDPAKLVYDEHGMQLAAYAHGLGFHTYTMVSVFVDRKTLEALAYEWPCETRSKYLSMFKSLLEYWQLSKGYKPQF